MSLKNRSLSAKTSFRRPIGLIVLGIACLLILPGCVSRIVAGQMVGAPNQSLIGEELSQQFSSFDEGHTALLKLKGVSENKIGLPERGIHMSFINITPADYGFSYKTHAIRFEDGRSRKIHSDWQWYSGACAAANQKFLADSDKTLVMLHGWGRHKNSLLSYGMAFAQQGYRVIIPDLRGHGQTSGDWVSFGMEEAKDVRALLNSLNIEQFDLFGFSLGASTSLHIAARDQRVGRLAVVAPMHSLAQTIPKFVKQSPEWVGRILSFVKQDALIEAGELSGYSFTQTSDTVSSARLVNQPVLFVYGAVDNMSGKALNNQLFQTASGNKQIVELSGLRHTHVLLHQTALLKPVNQWFGLEPPATELVRKTTCEYETFQD